MPIAAAPVLSIQLYSARKFPPFERQLEIVASCGYSAVETFGDLYEDAATTSRLLRAYGLVAPTGHFSVEKVLRAPARVVDIARTLGVETVVIASAPPNMRPKNREGWRDLGRQLKSVSETYAAQGLRLAWHNHGFEFAALEDGSLPVEHILGDTLLWEPDIARVARAKADPTEWLERYRGRYPSIHVKDIALIGKKAKSEDGWANIGEGSLPLRDLCATAIAGGAQVMIAEHDNPSDFERFARVSAAALRDYTAASRRPLREDPSSRLKVGVIGCGSVSDAYFMNARLFRDIAVVACADINVEAAKAQADRYGVAARPVEALLSSDDIDIVLNLTVPAAHAKVSEAAIAAGKHVYSEKPLATTLADGRRLIENARSKGLRIGSAPDTILSAAVQEARRLIDEGATGRPLVGLATVLSHGVEDWHPNPAFLFQPGAGPLFDMGPYYLSTLVTLCGPIAHVSALAQIGSRERAISAPNSPSLGQTIAVETPTSVQALLEFESGGQVTLFASWDVWRHGALPIELHCENASLRLPDPNWFGGPLLIARGREEWEEIRTADQRYGRVNWPRAKPQRANDRGLGLSGMANAVPCNRRHRANGELALHTLAVMEAILEAAQTRRRVAVAATCDRPDLLSMEEARNFAR